MTTENIKTGMVIIGGGQAGARAAISLRESGWTGAIDLVCAEPHRPYKRPVLSKSYLNNDLSTESFLVGGADVFELHEIQLRLGIVATHINSRSKTVQLSDGTWLPYSKLLIATGRIPRGYSVSGLLGRDVMYIRTIEDAQCLKDSLSSQVRLGIIGAGYIGLEVASMARAMGCSIDVIEMGKRILARGVSDRVSDFVLERHKKEGVRFRFNQTVTKAIKSGQGYELHLSNQETLEIDAVLAGVGAIPDCRLATKSGIKVDRGIVVNEYLKTSDPDIFAAGDVTILHDSRSGKLRECQNWECSNLQGDLAARNMLGAEEPYNSLDWMWSDHYDLTIQNLGDTDNKNTVVDRHLESGVITFFLNKDQQLVGVSAVGDKRIGRSVSICRRLIDSERSLVNEQLIDSEIDLKKILKAVGT